MPHLVVPAIHHKHVQCKAVRGVEHMCLTDVEAQVSLHRADRQGVNAGFGPTAVKPALVLAPTQTSKALRTAC